MSIADLMIAVAVKFTSVVCFPNRLQGVKINALPGDPGREMVQLLAEMMQGPGNSRTGAGKAWRQGALISPGPPAHHSGTGKELCQIAF